MTERVLIIGSNGQVGRELVEVSKDLGEVIAVSRNSVPVSIDLLNHDSIRNVIRKIKPTIIINAAAYTAVDDAEQEVALATKINSDAPGVIAEEAKLFDALLVHYSTDYVFDGTKNSPYEENDYPNPINEYGKSKLSGEKLIQAANCRYLIFRTSWVYSPNGNNFVKSIIRLSNERDELNIVDDQIGCPNSAHFIATTTAKVLEKYIQRCRDVEAKDTFELHGIYNLSSSKSMSWYEFSKKIICIGYERKRCKKTNISPIPSSDYPTAAKRPQYSVLSNKKLFDKFKIDEMPWVFYLEKCIDSI